MKFLTDQDVYARTIRFMRDLGHDVVTASDLGMSRAEDIQLLTVAQEKERIFITRDRDFGALVFVQGFRGGVIYLRIQTGKIELVHSELKRLLSESSEADLLNAFVTVEPSRYRFRNIESK
jgi:predicted nuclease of predicted toxin-antitoxin system